MHLCHANIVKASRPGEKRQSKEDIVELEISKVVFSGKASIFSQKTISFVSIFRQSTSAPDCGCCTKEESKLQLHEYVSLSNVVIFRQKLVTHLLP